MSREMQSRSYTVAGQTFTVALEEPWHFMTYTPVVAERIAPGTTFRHART